MTPDLKPLLACVALAAMTATGVSVGADRAWPDPASLPAQPGFPDPLVMLAGDR